MIEAQRKKQLDVRKNGTDDELHGQIFETTRNEHHLLQTIRRRGHHCSDRPYFEKLSPRPTVYFAAGC